MATEKKEFVGEVILTNVRLSFADIYEPAKDRKDSKTDEVIKGKFGANFLMEKGTAETKANQAKIKKAGHDAKVKKWGENEAKWPKLKPEKLCLRDGDLEDYDGYEGNLYLSANNGQKPQVITNRKDKNKKWVEAAPGTPNSPYSGCFVNALVRLWVQDNEHGKRLNASLEVVQFLRDGTPFGAAPVDPNERFTDDMVGQIEHLSDDDEDEDDELV
jgi:hypothetical protein